MSNQQPRKKRSKYKRVHISAKQHWQRILRDIDTDHIPITMLQAISVNLIDGTRVRINIKDLLDSGADPDELEQSMRLKIEALDAIIKDVDFYIDIDAVANTVQPMTDHILRNL